ncbi:MAG: SUMF1/EgtB/PvdO family nonheme iron enzyme [Phycisphaerae bacterium]
MTHVDGVVSLAGDGTVVFDAGVGGAVAFDAAASVYSVVGDLHERPVTGVSWYGAAKFCNWMTGVQGMGDAELVYVESDVAGGWGAGGFDPATPGTNRNGFRLPLDDGATTAAARNEWNKAATRMMTADGDDPSFDAVYGFGRDVLTGADANFLASGDPFDDAVSPIGFFDGVETLTSGGVTSDTANGYGLYDVCGNVAEWVHERVSAEPGVWTSATRGGHFGLAVGADLLRNDARDTLPANSVFGFVGFRVAQSLEPVPLLVVQASDQVRADGPIGGPYAFDNDDDRLTLGLDNDGAYTLDTLDISIDQAWVEIDGVAPQQVPPQTIVDLPLRLTDAADDLPASPVPPGDLELVPGRNAEPGGPNEQPAGPTYDFWVSAIEVTNDQFAVFLNDALAHPTTGRGRYMCHDGDTGNVYINNAEDGVSGGGVCDGLTTLLYDASIGRIQFDADASPAYFVASGFGTHPVVGVTWYGAVKYCNWLTLFAGLPEGVRAYTESTEPAGWHPVTVTTADWQAGGFSAAQRQDLIRTTVGYRLPMDDGADVASTYNEWYKAAAWDRATTSDAVYGFGRDKLTPSDANYFDSGDPFEPDEACPDCGTTPVRFYDGTNELADDETATSDTANGYRLFDVCGNVAEWTQDFFQPGDASLRAVRGGSWVDPPTAVSLTNAGREAVSPDAANDHTGFRVVRGTGHIATVTVTDRIADVTDTAHVILDVREPLDITPFAGITASGTYGDDFAAPAVPDTTYTVLNTSAAAMGWQASVDETWLTATDADGGPLSGTLDAGASVSLTVATVDGANALAPGEHAAVVTIENTTTGVTQTRDAVLSIDWPIDVTVGDPPLPDDVVFDGFFGGPFENPADATLTLGSVVGFDLTYDVSVDAGWVTLVPADPDGALTGDLPAGGSRDFTVSINAAANALSVGDHDATLAFAFCDPGNCLCEAGCEPDPCSAGGCNLTATLERTVTLSVLDPIVIEPTEPWVIDEPLDPGVPPTQATVYTVTNHHAGLQIGVDIALEAGVDWLDVSATSVTPLPGGASGSEEVTVSLNANALLLPHGEHDATITFTDTFTGHAQDRVVTLVITENLSIQPADVFVSSGQPGVAVAPAFRIYELTNNIGETPDTIIWSVDTDPGVAWVSFAVAGDGIEGGVPNVDRPLADGASVHVVVSIDAALTAGLPDGVYDVDVVFVDVTHGESITRPIRLTLVTPSFTVGEAIIPGTDVQVNGPTYAFVMGRFAVTNAEFAAFLNDAYHAIGDPSDPRGQYMYHDTDTGDVYINDAQAAASGAAAPFGSVTTLMYDASIGRISFDAMEPDPYVVAVGLEQHPVVGVSWFGALKFCNWLTLDQGLLPGERCYAESTGDDVDGWHPISITTSNWATRDLTDAERQALVDGCRGYRLPMDDGADNNTPTIDSADAYNEWYKAASAHIMNQDGEDHVVFGAVYGFGRDAIVVQGPDAGRDANYECSGDPFEPVGACTDGGTTPVGYYDGTDHGGAYATNGNDNAFGLFDMSGNVYEWMQGRFVGSSANFRAIRGGSWHTGTPDAPLGQSSLRTRARNVAPVSGSVIVSDQVGFRIVRALSGSADFDGDGDVDAVDFMQLGTCMSGPVGPPLPACTAVDLNADGQVDLRDIAVFQGAFTGEP